MSGKVHGGDTRTCVESLDPVGVASMSGTRPRWPDDGDYSRVVDKQCKRVKQKRAHEPHEWIAGVYYPAGNVDGYPARCSGYDSADS